MKKLKKFFTIFVSLSIFFAMPMGILAEELRYPQPKVEIIDSQTSEDLPESLNDDSKIQGISAVTVTRNTNKRYEQKDVFAKKEFITSVAKGQTKQLGKTFDASLSPSGVASGISLSGTIKVSYNETDTFKGPDSGNGTEFWVYFYQNIGYYDQEIYVNGAKIKTNKIKFTEPTRYRIYPVNY